MRLFCTHRHVISLCDVLCIPHLVTELLEQLLLCMCVGCLQCLHLCIQPLQLNVAVWS